MLLKWSAHDLLLCSSRNRGWSKRAGSLGNSPLLNRRGEWRWGSGAMNRLNDFNVFESKELSQEEKKKRMEMGIWSFEPPEEKQRMTLKPVVDILSKKSSSKRSNNNTPRKEDQNNFPKKKDPLIDIKKQQQIAEQQELRPNNASDVPNGLSQHQLVTEVNKGSTAVPPLEANISTVCEEMERVPPSDTITISDRSTVDGSMSPDRKSSGRPGSTRKLFTKVTATEHLTRKDVTRASGGRPQSGRPAAAGNSPIHSGRKSAPTH